MSRKQRLGLPGLAAIIFYSVSGGPYGSEGVVAAAGPLLALVGFAVVPLVWSVQEALVTAELATAFPKNAGYAAWVSAAFGPRWGFLEGFLSWLSGATDLALYPVLFSDYLEKVWPAEHGFQFPRRLCIVAFSLLLTALNYAGVELVGWFALALAVFILLPFLYVVPVALAQADPSNLALTPAWEEVRWKKYVNLLFWNLNYWDSCSTLAGEVQRPQDTFPLALGLTLIGVVGVYLLPLAAGVGLYGNDWRKWDNGLYAELGAWIGGVTMKLWIACSSAASSVGQFLSEQAEGAYQLEGMASLGWLPKSLSWRSSCNAPSLGLLLSLCVSLVFSTFGFEDVVDFVSAVYCQAQLLEFAAFVQLRRSRPELRRPFKVPLAHWISCLVFLAPAGATIFLVLSFPVLDGDWTQVTYLAALPCAGLLLYSLLMRLRKYRPLSFACSPAESLDDLCAAGVTFRDESEPDLSSEDGSSSESLSSSASSSFRGVGSWVAKAGAGEGSSAPILHR